MRGGKHTGTCRLVLVLAVAVSVLGWPAVSQAAAPSAQDELAAGIAAAINNERAERGLRRLTTSPRLRRAARAHALSMGRKGFFSHSSAGGASFGHRLQSFYGSRSVGEVLYWQQGLASARDVVAAWLGSAPHRASLLTRRWREIGVAAVFVRNAPGAFRGRDVTLVVADFGTRR